MTPIDRLDPIAEQYRSQGYDVVVRPGPGQLPHFAASFQPDLMATRGDGSVLVAVKNNRSELQSDPELFQQAEAANGQPGWKFDLVILEGTPPGWEAVSHEPSGEQIERMVAESERLVELGMVHAGVVLAWAGLEASMRRVGQRAGVGGRIGTEAPTLVREMYSSGHLSAKEFRTAEKYRGVRNQVVHGLETACHRSRRRPRHRGLSETSPRRERTDRDGRGMIFARVRGRCPRPSLTLPALVTRGSSSA